MRNIERIIRDVFLAKWTIPLEMAMNGESGDGLIEDGYKGIRYYIPWLFDEDILPLVILSRKAFLKFIENTPQNLNEEGMQLNYRLIDEYEVVEFKSYSVDSAKYNNGEIYLMNEVFFFTKQHGLYTLRNYFEIWHNDSYVNKHTHTDRMFFTKNVAKKTLRTILEGINTISLYKEIVEASKNITTFDYPIFID